MREFSRQERSNTWQVDRSLTYEEPMVIEWTHNRVGFVGLPLILATATGPLEDSWVAIELSSGD